MNMSVNENPWRECQVSQHDGLSIRALVVFGHRNGEWRAVEWRAGQKRIFERIGHHCKVKFAGTNTGQKFASISRLEINPQPGIQRKLHRAKDGG
jgi:hypothetical protein